MAFIPRFTLTGAPPLVRTYAIAASEEWDVYDVLNLNAARALVEPSAATNDVMGAALGNVGNTTAGQSDADDLRSYVEALTTGSHEPVSPFCPVNVHETDDFNAAGTAAAADVGERANLELVSGNWGINNGVTSGATTPKFAIIDINDTRSTYYVVPDIILQAGVFQWYDASV